MSTAGYNVDKIRMRAYAMWNFTKWVGGSAILMSMAISRQDAIQSIYTTSAACAAAYAAALADPTHYYEYGLCSFSWQPGLKWLSNLMTEEGTFSDFGSTSSSVALYLWYAGLVFALIGMFSAAILVVAFNAHSNRESNLDWAAMIMNVVFVALLMAVANEIFQLYLLNGFYVSAWDLRYMVASHVMTTMFFLIFFVYWIIESFTETSEMCRLFVGLILFTLFGCFTIFSVILAIVNYRTSGDNIHIIVNGLLFLSLLEIPYCLCQPGLRKIFNGLHEVRPMSAAEEAEARAQQEQYDAEDAAAQQQAFDDI